MNHYRGILIRYDEIALKGGNRSKFEKLLVKNARAMIGREDPENRIRNVDRTFGRVILNTQCSRPTMQALGRTFGISSFSPVRQMPTEWKAIQASAIEEFRALVKSDGLPTSFRVDTRRVDKQFSLKSPEVDRELGSLVQESFPNCAVSLTKPEVVLGVEIRQPRSLVWTRKWKGQGGMPVGAHAKLTVLISGGIDSPVAAIQIMKRGVPVDFLHFHGAPFVGQEVLDKIHRLVGAVKKFSPTDLSLNIVPFGKIQEKIAGSANSRYRTILFRRSMMRIASRFSAETQGAGLVTGESVGQVASQTVVNLGLIDGAADSPVFRPLVGMDKSEIVEKAQRWETFQLSIEDVPDCCVLLSDRHPETSGRREVVEEEESKLCLLALENEAYQTMSQVVI